MGRRNRSPEEQERRAKIWELLQLSNVSSAESDQGQICFPYGRQPAENAVSGHDQYYEKVDRTAPRLEQNPRLIGRLFR